MHNAHLTEQLTDIILAIIQDSVDARIEQRIADLQDGIDAVASFDINNHREDIVAMVRLISKKSFSFFLLFSPRDGRSQD